MYCCASKLIKYLFKYISKGSDRILTVIESHSDKVNDSSSLKTDNIDEIKNYLDCHYISPCEATWRLYEFPIQYREPTIERSKIHLPLMNNVVFRLN